LPAITEEIGTGATAALAGLQPPPIRLDFIQWIMRLLPVIPLLQIAGVVATLRLSRSWRRAPSSCPRGGALWGRHILLPLIPTLGLAALRGALQSSGLLRFIDLFMPDLAWIIRVGGRFAGLWAPLRTGLLLRTARDAKSESQETLS
jgi:hypothetical protein